MRNLLFLVLLYSAQLSAISWQVIGPCDKAPVYSGQETIDLSQSVGRASVKVFDQNQVPYIGNEVGMNSILGTPTGNDAIEVISDTEMRAYGWCYQVDGFEPDVLPNQYFFNHQSNQLTWLFGFAHYKDGQWLSYCTPAHTIRPDFLCGE